MEISKSDLKVLLAAAGWECQECGGDSCSGCELAKVFDKFEKERREADE